MIEIFYVYVWEQGQVSGLDEINFVELVKWFLFLQFLDIGDEIVDGELFEFYDYCFLVLFDVFCIDFFLKCLQYYIGMLVQYFQCYLLFINYYCYVDVFVDWGFE